MSDADLPPEAELTRQLSERLEDVSLAVGKLCASLPKINDTDLRSRILVFTNAAERVLEVYEAEPGPDVAEKLSQLLNGIRAFDAPARDQILGPTPALELLEQATGLIAIRLIKALDVAAAKKWVPKKATLPDRVIVDSARGEFATKLLGIADRLESVATSLNDLELTKGDTPGFPQQSGLVEFYIGSVRVEVDLARMHLEAGEKWVDLSALATIGETIGELTKDFLATVRAWISRLSEPVVRLSEIVRIRVQRAVAEIGRVVRWATETASATSADGSAGEQDDMSSTVQPEDFHVTRVKEMILEGRAPPQSWQRFVTKLEIDADSIEHVQTYDWDSVMPPSTQPAQTVDFDLMAGFTNMEVLDIENMPLENFSKISALTSLRLLNLQNARIRSIEPLSSLIKLHVLNLENTPVRNLKPLANLTNLQSLNLRRTSIKSIAPLETLVELRTLNICETSVKDIWPLALLTNIETLYLQDTKVLDISVLSGLVNLRYLDISQTAIEDVGPLQVLTNLRSLYIDGSYVKDVKALQNLTKLKIYRGSG